MATNFKYASLSDLTKYFNRVSDFDNKRQLFGFTLQESGEGYASSPYLNPNSGLVNNLYKDGNDLGSGKQTIGTSTTTLANEVISSSEVEIDVDSGSACTAESYIKIDDEIMYISSISTNTLTCIRGRLGTSAEAHADDSIVYQHFFPSSAGQWLYDSDNDFVIISASSDVSDNIIEAGEDYSTFINQALVDASLELHNYLDARYSTPLEKIKQVDSDTAALSVAEEFDPIIIKSVCYKVAANLIRAKEGSSEEADYFDSLVTNADRTGIIDKLNDGIYKLSHEVDANDKKGSVRYRNVSGTMDLVELGGEYHGE